MMSSEERKQIVAYLYKLIKESPLFREYTDDRIREAAVRAEHKAYTSSSTKDEYLRAMNTKAERIKSTKTNESKSKNEFDSKNELSQQPMYQEINYQSYGRKEQPYVSQRTYNKSADLYQNGLQQTTFYNNREMPTRNQPLFSSLTIKDANKNYDERLYKYNGNHSGNNGFNNGQNVFNAVNNNFNNNNMNNNNMDMNNSFGFGHPPISPRNSSESFLYVNELNGNLRLGENSSFGHMKYDQGGYQNINQPYPGGYQPRTGFITERGFHTNQNLFELNYQEPQYVKFQPAKKMSDFKPSVSNLKYRQRYEEPYPPQETFVRRGTQNNASFYRHPRTSPIGMAPPKKSERSFSTDGQAYSRQIEKIKPVKRPDLRRGGDVHGGDIRMEEGMREDPRLDHTRIDSRQVTTNDQRQIDPRHITRRDLKLSSENAKHKPMNKSKKKVEIDESQANELFNSFGSLFESHNNDSTFDNPSNFFEVAPSKRSLSGKSEEGAESQKDSQGKTRKKETQKREGQKKTLSGKILESTIDANNYENVIDVGKIQKKSIETNKVEIPNHVKEFITANNLTILSNTDLIELDQLSTSLLRCEETQLKVAKIYAEHKNEFPQSKLHESYIHADTLINKQREYFSISVFFLTWRCVDDLLDTLKRAYIDMKVELNESRNVTIVFSDAINNAYNAFHSAKKRDKDFVLDLRNK